MSGGVTATAQALGKISARPDIVLVVAVAENGVIGAKGAIPWRLKSDMQHFKALTIDKPVVMGRKTFVSLRRPLSRRTNIVVTRDANYRAAGAVVTTSFDSARAVATGDALRRFATEIAVIGGAEIYVQWIGIADRLELTEVHARPEGDTRFATIDAALWQEVTRVRNPAGPDDSADFSYVTYIRRPASPMGRIYAKVALTASANVCIDNYGLRHSCFEPEACVVRAGAVPYKAVQITRPGALALSPVEESVYAVEESRRRPMGLRSERTLGLWTATSGTAAARS